MSPPPAGAGRRRLRSRLRAGTAPADGEVHAYQQEFYDHHPGITEGLIGKLRTAGGQTSYEVLMAALPAAGGATLLDLACGAGLLTVLCRQAVGPAGRVVAVDFNPSQVALARRRARAPNVGFRCESAAALSLPTGSMDAVLCHLALMLMRPIEPIVAELARVLRPGGRLAAVVGPEPGRSALYDRFAELLAAKVASELPGFSGLGDPRTLTLDGLGSLLNQATGFAPPLRCHEFAILFRGRPHELAPGVARFFNLFHLLSAAGQRRFIERARGLLADGSADPAGELVFAAPLRRIAIDRLGRS